MELNKKIVFIGLKYNDIIRQLEILMKYKKIKNWNVIAVVSDYKSQVFCKKNNIDFKTTIEYLTPKRHKRAAEKALNFTKKWYKKSEIEGALSHKGISFCEIMEYVFYMIFAGLFFDIELYSSIIEDEKPDKIVLIKRKVTESKNKNLTNMNGHDNFIVSLLTKGNKISVELVEPEFDSTNEDITGKKPIVKRTHRLIKTLKRQSELMRIIDWKKEIRYKVQIIWYYFLSRWFAEYIIKTFSRKKNKLAFAGTVRAANNLADRLKKDQLNGVVCLKLPGSNKIPLNILPVIDLNFFNTPKIETIVSKKRKEFMALLQNDNFIKHFEKEFVYDGILFWQPMKQKLEYVFGEYIPLMVHGVECTKKMIDRVGLDILLSTSDRNPIICSIIKTLQSERKKAFVYLHGIDYFDEETSKIYGQTLIPVVADKVATWGDAARDWFIQQGVPPEKVVSTSCSYFDDYIRILNYSKENLKQFLGVGTCRVILYALDHGNKETVHLYHGETRDEVIKHLKEVIDIIEKIPDICLIVRPHPGDKNKNEIKEIVENSGKKNILFNPNLPLPYLLRITDLLFVYTSSTGIESMIFDANVIVYNTTRRPEPVPYVKNEAAVRVTKKEDIAKTVLDLLENETVKKQLSKNRKKFVKYCAGPIDGNATKNIIDSILQLIDT